MELRGMFGHQPVRVVVVANEWLDIIEISSGDELASVPLQNGVHLDGDLLSVGDISIVVDRSFLSEAQGLMKFAARTHSPVVETSDSSPPLFCTQCGARKEQEAKFCTNCGGALVRAPEESPSFNARSRTPGISASFPHDSNHAQVEDEPRMPDVHLSNPEIRRRNIIFLVAVVVVAAVVVVVARSGGDSSTNSSVDITATVACDTLSRYAFVGIPATYVQDGAELLYSLADEFDALDRGDIAGRIEDIVDLTYQGPSGQLSAKNLLVETAAIYC